MLSRRDFIKITALTGALATSGFTSKARAAVSPILPDTDKCLEGAGKIPVIGEYDLVVAGGSSRAVAAAAAAAKCGASVFLAAYLPYLGDDVCGAYLFERAKDETLNTALSRRVFSSVNPAPMHVKTVLEDELISNDVAFLYSSYVTDAVTGPDGSPAGVVIANRSGRFAIRCKSIIDATHDGSVSRMFGAEYTDFKAGDMEFSFTVVGNLPKSAPEFVNVREWTKPVNSKGTDYKATTYTFRYPIKADSHSEYVAAEHFIRGKVWDPEQVDSSDRLWYVPQRSLRSRGGFSGCVRSLRQIPESAFQPASVKNVWVLGPAADIDRKSVAHLMRPVQAMFLGELLGEQVGSIAKGLSVPASAMVKCSGKGKAFNYGRISEFKQPLRPSMQKGYVDTPGGALPVLGTYDVVVMGGGTAGANAGYSAAHHGAKTLVLEYLHGLGGLSTLGMIGVYWDGFREGYTALVDKGVYAMAPEDHPRRPKRNGRFPADWKMEYFRRQCLAEGADVWFDVLGCGAVVDAGRVVGVVVATPSGRGVVLSKLVIDSTGSADIAIHAGAGFEYTGKKTLAVQGAGTGIRNLGDYYRNNDWLFVDDTDIWDVSRAYVQAKAKFRGEFDMVKIPQTRERRRIIGDYTVNVYDVMGNRRFVDTISYHRSSFDTHGYITDPLFLLNPPEKRHMIYDADVPLRALLPKGLEGILCTGLGASAHRDAMPVIRMQPCLHNQGYAVGYLAAMAVKEGKTFRQMDMKKIQPHLVEMGTLPARVLKEKDFKGYSSSEMKQAASGVTDNYKGLEILLTQPQECSRLLSRQIVRTTDAEARLILASILCMLGDKTYSSVVADAVRSYAEWDEGWHYTGMGQFGPCLSRLDSLVTALGKSKDTSELKCILDKALQLVPEDVFSHFRAICQSTESMGSRDAVPVLADMLVKPGVRNHYISDFADARRKAVPGTEDTSTREAALKELHIARALYLLGDSDGLAEDVLRRYADGLQGHYARYAQEILASR